MRKVSDRQSLTKTNYSSMVTTSTDSENERLEIIKDSESENGSGKLNKMAASQVLFSYFIFQLTLINRVSFEHFLILDFPAEK